MKIKKIMLMSLLLLAVLTISAVSATDNLTEVNEDVLQDTSSEEIGLSDEINESIISSSQDEILKTDDGTFTALQNKINNATENSTVTLESDYLYDNEFTKNGISISKSLTIDGKGHFLDGNKNRIFTVQSHVILQNIIFINGNASCGGALNLLSSCTIINCTFLNNSAVEMGGAIYAEKGYCNIINSTFTNNVVTDKNSNYGGGAIHSETKSNITNSTFTYNQAKWGGAIQYNVWGEGPINIRNSKFINNYAVWGGGGIDVTQATLIDCEFINSTVKGQVSRINTSSSTANNVDNNTINTTITKVITSLTASKVTAIYKVSKKLTVTLKDANGNALSSKKVTIKVGSISKTLTTGFNGQVSLDVSTLVPKAYTASITFAGDDSYIASSNSVSVFVKKATPKITAKAKTFKKSVKTKKYSITLKDNKNKVMKNIKVTIKVNKKTYTAKTNSKGVATFKITKLNKKGTFKATVTYKGNSNYNKVTKKVNIKCK